MANHLVECAHCRRELTVECDAEDRVAELEGERTQLLDLIQREGLSSNVPLPPIHILEKYINALKAAP